MSTEESRPRIGHTTSNSPKNEKELIVEYPLMGKIYDHYKGGRYRVLFMAKDSNDEPVVVHQSLLFGSYHVRPLKEWFEIVCKMPKYRNDVERFHLSTKQEG